MPSLRAVDGIDLDVLRGTKMMNAEAMPFDVKRMTYGSIATLVDL